MDGMVYVVVLAAVAVAIWVGSLSLHPWTTCSRCKGSAKHRGLFYTSAHRPCVKCGGTGRQLRFGRRLILGPPQ